MSARRRGGTPPASKQRAMLNEHNKSVQERLLPHLRRKPKSIRAGWIERRVKELVA